MHRCRQIFVQSNTNHESCLRFMKTEEVLLFLGIDEFASRWIFDFDKFWANEVPHLSFSYCLFACVCLHTPKIPIGKALLCHIFWHWRWNCLLFVHHSIVHIRIVYCVWKWFPCIWPPYNAFTQFNDLAFGKCYQHSFHQFDSLVRMYYWLPSYPYSPFYHSIYSL